MTCDFCQTQYSVTDAPRGPVRCAVCGHTWTPARGRANAVLLVISALCALMAAAVFCVAIIARSRIDAARAVALRPAVTEIVPDVSDDGAPVLVVRGTVTNNTDDIYGMPDLVITARDGADHVIVRHRVMPSATLIDAHGVVQFSYSIASTPDIRRIGVDIMGGI